jgi:hypothetical protein
MGVWRQATLASATVSFAQIRKIAFTWVAGDWAKQRKPEFEFALCPLLALKEVPKAFANREFHHGLRSRLVRNAASKIGSWQSVSIADWHQIRSSIECSENLACGVSFEHHTSVQSSALRFLPPNCTCGTSNHPAMVDRIYRSPQEERSRA